ncbi:PAS domain-containing hybrid sensor histidine kinase/response regulator [Shewanella sp. Arc9-LZ]|uniref:PAS domain-containing hybrid sensor histidine kinase/response regulator n=1 Tax=Shewanella sp. Arc9-LZ TaxID=2698686 RepID=UPI00137BE64F|nr:PAS domain-containing hybrid sensor histidine kinase/response regulator [Shewanella sp. Arc9-LZ]QHS13634.1 response regulator [Shewanella sp. Arc9-LZ]
MADESRDEQQVQIQYALVEKLSHAQKRQTKLLELLDECIFECNDQLELTYTNPAWKKRLGYDRESLNKMNLCSLISSSTQLALLEVCLHKLAYSRNNVPTIIEVQLKLLNGQHHWFELKLVQDGDGGYIGSLFEIQQHKDIQAQLLHQQNYVKRLSLVASHTKNLVVITNREGFIEWVNKSFEESTGYILKNIMGKKPGHLLQGKDSNPQTITLMSEALRQGKSFQTDIINYNCHGEPYWVNINTSPVVDSTGNISHFIAVQTDISENRAALKVLQEAKYQAEQLSEAKSRFMANISHEIRTPLNAVIGSADILLESGLTREQTRFTDMIRTSSDALLSILDDVLTYSRFEAGKINIVNEPFKLDRCLEEAIDIVSGPALEKGLSVILNIMPTVPLAIIGDKARIRQILINLLANAVKFTPQGEVVVSVNYMNNDDQLTLQITVQDTGIGIEADKIEQMFEAFMQSDTSSTRVYGGSGLGLAICRQICEAMGGDICVESTLGVGSRFIVEIPLKLEPKICDSTAKIINNNKYSHCWVVGQNNSLNPAVYNMLQHYSLTYSAFNNPTDLPQQLADNVDIIVLTEPNQLQSCRDYLQAINNLKSTKVCFLSIDLLGQESSFVYNNQNEIQLNGPFKLSHLSWALELLDDPLVNLELTHSCESGFPASLALQFTDKHVLIVEDNINNQAVLSQLLVQVGCEVHCAENGQAALNYLAEHKTDLILMDIQMPVMDGITATEKIRSGREIFSQTPIIAVTANAIHGDKKRFIQAGMNDYLAKPINRDSLYELLQRYLNSTNSVKRSKLDKLQYTLDQLNGL